MLMEPVTNMSNERNIGMNYIAHFIVEMYMNCK
jgi:hypothetical protein